MEKAIFQRIMPIAQAMLKTFFATQGTGDQGEQILREDGVVLKRESGLRKRNYTSIFGTLAIDRTCYRVPGEPGVFPLDEQVNLPQRCYSYWVQEWMNLLSLDHPFEEGAQRLQWFFGLELTESVMANVSRDGSQDYEAFYEQKIPPAPDEEGEYQMISIDGKGVPVINHRFAPGL